MSQIPGNHNLIVQRCPAGANSQYWFQGAQIWTQIESWSNSIAHNRNSILHIYHQPTPEKLFWTHYNVSPKKFWSLNTPSIVNYQYLWGMGQFGIVSRIRIQQNHEKINVTDSEYFMSILKDIWVWFGFVPVNYVTFIIIII